MSSDNDIRKQFQERFSDFRADVPVDGWERLEKALSTAPVVSMPRRRWRTAVSAAAAVLLLVTGGLLFMQRPGDKSEPMLTESIAPAPSILEPSVSESSAPETISASAEASVKKNAVQSKKTSIPTLARTRGEVALVVAETHVRQEEPVRPARPAGITVAHAPSHREKVKEATAKIKSLVKEVPSEDILIAAADDEGLFAGDAGHDDRKPVLLALNGRGGLTSYQQTVNTPMTLRSASVAPDVSEENKKNSFINQGAGNNVSEMEHDQPISVGLTVSKEIVKDLYIETGLVYSYLYSRVRNAHVSYQEHETQRLHYVGIPVNVNYNVLSLNRLNLYVSVGGMFEKDVHGDFRGMGEGEAMLNSQSEKMEVTKISQRNPQLSVNAGVGLSYPIYNQLRLYGKIGGAYYFDAKNEYKTIYSDRKIVMDLNVGLRYEF